MDQRSRKVVRGSPTQRDTSNERNCAKPHDPTTRGDKQREQMGLHTQLCTTPFCSLFFANASVHPETLHTPQTHLYLTAHHARRTRMHARTSANDTSTHLQTHKHTASCITHERTPRGPATFHTLLPLAIPIQTAPQHTPHPHTHHLSRRSWNTTPQADVTVMVRIHTSLAEP